MTNESLGVIWARFKHSLSRLTDSDWLLFLLGTAVIVILTFNGLTLANRLFAGHQAPHFLAKLTLLTLLVGYFDSWRRQNSVGNAANILTNDRWPISTFCLVVLLIAFPVASFYGRLANLTYGGIEFTSTVTAGGLIIGAGLIGIFASRLKSGWALLSVIILGWLICRYPAPFSAVESGLVGGSGVVGILLAVGVVGTIITVIELWPKSLTTDSRRRYLSLLASRANFPSFTGTGAMIISGLLLMARDKFFWAVIGFSAVLSYFGLTQLTDFGSQGTLILAVILPLSIVAAFIASQLERFGQDLTGSQEHWPIIPQAVDLALFIAGLAAIGLVSLMLDQSLLQQPLGTSLEIFGLTIGAYSVVALLDPSPAKGVYGWVWPIIYRLIAFITAAIILAGLSLGNLFFFSLILLTLALFGIGYHSRSR